jgi:hypothetical protein
MAESLAQFTEGVGKKFHTWARTVGANTVEDQYALIGENALASYIISAGPIALATANSHLLQIMAGASLKVRIRRIEIWQAAAVTAAALSDILLYRLTTAGTGGGGATVGQLDGVDAAAGATSQSLPTVKGTEAGTFFLRSFPYLMQTIGASTPATNPVVMWDFDRLRSKPLIIAAGTANGIAIKNTAAQAAGSVVVTVWLDESSYL